MNVSKQGVDLIKSFEGFVGHPYRDQVGVWTIGYGHTEGVGPNSPHITEVQAAALLQRDLDRKYAPPVNALKLPLNQNQFDALVSFVYNLGPGVLDRNHTIGVALRAQKWQKAADAMLLYNHAGGRVSAGLTRRRQAERALFMKAAPKPRKYGSRELKLGDQGDDVRELQRVLSKISAPFINQDGDYGPATEKAKHDAMWKLGWPESAIKARDKSRSIGKPGLKSLKDPKTRPQSYKDREKQRSKK